MHPGLAAVLASLRTLQRLSWKEVRSLLRDGPLLALVAFSFTAAVYLTAVGIKADVDNATVAVVDEDQSALSRQLVEAIRPPHFQPPRRVQPSEVDRLLDRGETTFVLQIPPHFEADLRAGRRPPLLLRVDATALTQAGLGTLDLQQILEAEATRALGRESAEARLPFVPVLRVMFNPNAEARWYSGVMQIITNVTALTLILVGAAVMREKEHGTLEHLLVMPVRPHEIALAKMGANGALIVLAVMGSVVGVVHGVLGVPLPAPAGATLGLLALGTAFYVFALAALGVGLATLTRSMPQFSLLSAPVYVVLYLVSGASTPIESMPAVMQTVVRWVPSTQYAQLTQAVLYRGAGLEVVWPALVALALFGLLALLFALRRFRAMLARQG